VGNLHKGDWFGYEEFALAFGTQNDWKQLTLSPRGRKASALTDVFVLEAPTSIFYECMLVIVQYM
jgi:hypothetical protein